MGPFGASELIFLFIAALIIFGPKKLPEIGKTIGKGMREFKKATDDLKSNWEDHLKDTDSPVHDLKQTIAEIKSDVETSTSDLTGGVEESVHEVQAEVDAATSIEEKPALSTPSEETKPDAHAN